MCVCYVGPTRAGPSKLLYQLVPYGRLPLKHMSSKLRIRGTAWCIHPPTASVRGYEVYHENSVCCALTSFCFLNYTEMHPGVAYSSSDSHCNFPRLPRGLLLLFLMPGVPSRPIGHHHNPLYSLCPRKAELSCSIAYSCLENVAGRMSPAFKLPGLYFLCPPPPPQHSGKGETSYVPGFSQVLGTYSFASSSQHTWETETHPH